MSSGGNENRPNLQILSQYIKDLSFENPSAPAALTTAPEMDLGVDLKASLAGAPEHYEVELTLRVRASAENKPLFIVELAYAGLARLVNIPDDAIQRTLLIQVPHLLFPYARRILSDVVHDGGLPPVMIEPIDFAALYQAKMGQAAASVTAQA